MKSILFVCYGLGIGGIEKCLVNFVNALPENEYNIDLLLMNPYNELLSQIKRSYNILNSFDYVMNTTDYLAYLKKKGRFSFLKGLPRYFVFRILNKYNHSPWTLFRNIKKKYDIAIAYSHYDFSPKFVIDKVTASKKVMWYHYGIYEADKKKHHTDKNYYYQFDHVVAVSNDCSRSLRKAFPELGEKLTVLRNFCDYEEIIKNSKEFYPKSYADKTINIVTVARLTHEKGADLALDICKLLKGKGLKFCWHWVGDGNQKDNTIALITNNSLSDCFLLEGNQINPYPYIKYADIYVQPSYFEAYSTTITEAKILCKPIVTTDVGGMRDQLKNSINAYIVEINASKMANAIERLLTDPSIRNSFESSLKNEKLSFKNNLLEYKKELGF